MYKVNIEKKTLKNKNYRQVLHTTPQLQLVVMSIPVGEDIPREKHRKKTQFIRIEGGKGTITVGRKKVNVKDGDSVMIPPDTYHRVVNTGKRPLKLYALYSPPEHKKGLRQRKKPKSEH